MSFDIDAHNNRILNNHLDLLDERNKEYESKKEAAIDKVINALSETNMILELLINNDYITQEEVDIYWEEKWTQKQY